MALKHISTIFFDFGGTLFDFVPSSAEIWVKIADKLGHTLHTDDPCLLEGMRLKNKAYVRLLEENQYTTYSSITREDWNYFNQFVLNTLNVEQKEAINIALEEFNSTERRYKIFPDCTMTIQKLNAQGIRMGIISNTTPQRAKTRRPLLNTHGILDYFEVILLSSELGITKPQKEIFDMALHEMGIDDPTTAAHVGDCPYFDVKGARDAGFVPILLDPLGIKQTTGIKVRALSEIPELLS